MERTIYMDNAATTKPRKEVVEAMMPYLEEYYANPSSMYGIAMENQKVIQDSRKLIADTLGAESEEIYFTAGGSEADNWALKGVAHANREKGRHIITTKIEHHAVLNSCKQLEEDGYEVTYLNVDEKGRIRLEELEDAIREDTILISVMAANNEIGTIEPVWEAARIAKARGVLFHTDAVQMYGQMPMDVRQLQADLISVSGHKFRGPRGSGFLYVRKGTKICPFINGGGQERGMRAGTENTAAIVGMAKAAELAIRTMNYRIRKETYQRNYLIRRILNEIPRVRLNGHPYYRLPSNANFCFEGIEGESLLILLEMKGICGSAGSACTTGNTEPSHVLIAIGLDEQTANASLRLSINEDITRKELDYVVEILKESVQSLREKSG
ncbi:MAG: cysteine desulfurase [Lachnospiraceae bacterium]|nr:cysteine desulfurase [Lachnospiraceae bacterium]